MLAAMIIIKKLLFLESDLTTDSMIINVSFLYPKLIQSDQYNRAHLLVYSFKK